MVLAAGVALGAVAAHAAGRAPHPDAARLLQMAVLYQLVHGIALVLCRACSRGSGRRGGSPCRGRRFLAGVAFFCGSLYWLAFTGAFGGPAAPVGGSLVHRGLDPPRHRTHWAADRR